MWVCGLRRGFQWLGRFGFNYVLAGKMEEFLDEQNILVLVLICIYMFIGIGLV